MQHQSLAFGTLLGGRYRIERPLGAGAMGSVYQAMQDDLGRKVAIKVLHGSLALDQEAITRFQREAQAAAALGHPNIVQVIDFQWPQGEPPFLVMEYLDGRSLAEIVRAEGRVDGLRMTKIARQISSALEAAHNAGIVHRDIKPDNVLVLDVPGVGEVAKVLDFGIAKLERRTDAQLTGDGTMLGSPAYMAPEQARGGAIDQRADIFALGSTMYRALSGRLPFDAPSLNALLFAISDQAPTPLAQITNGLDSRLIAVVDRAMQKDPAARFQRASEMRAALEAILNGPATSAAAYSTSPILGSAASFGAAPTTTGYAPSAPPSPYAQPAFAPMMQAQPAPSSGGGAAVIGVLVVVMLVLLLGGGAGAAFFLMRGRAGAVDLSASTPSAAPAIGPIPAVAATLDPLASAQPGALIPGGKSSGRGGSMHDAGMSVAPSVDAGAHVAPAPAGPHVVYSGRNPSWGGGTYNNFNLDMTRAAIEAHMPRIQACYVQLEMVAPDHQFVYYRFRASKDGKILGFLGGPEGATAERVPLLDQCVSRILVGVSIGRPSDGKDGDILVEITARNPDNP